MAFDFTVMVLTGTKLVFTVPGRRVSGQPSRLMTLIFNDGLIYFVIAFLANLVATVHIHSLLRTRSWLTHPLRPDLHVAQFESGHVNRGECTGSYRFYGE